MPGTMLHMLSNGELGSSGVLEHVTQLVRQFEADKTGLKDKLQLFSHHLRTTRFQFSQLPPAHMLAFKLNIPQGYPEYVTAFTQLERQIGKSEKRVCVRPDVMQEYYALKTAGISIGQNNSYHLNNVLKCLASQNGAISIRFWGKILGYTDYFVIQGICNKPAMDLPSHCQPSGQGVNRYSYWVAHSVLGTWVELPLVTPQQMKASREFKHIFTGNMEQDIYKGKFIGKEKHLLKCVIARITHSCELAPKGIYKLNEENPSIVEFEEEFKMPEVSEMNSIESWIHLNPHILLQGRCTYFADPLLSEEQKEALNTELAEKDPMVERLKGIADDKPTEPFTTNWTVGICGETVPINQIGKQEGQSAIYGVTVVRNTVWNGAVTVGYRGGWTNLYVGYGHRSSQAYNLIRELRDLQVEGENKEQRGEPNPSKPKEEKKQEEVPVPPPE